jgi:monovalent cation/proton antiporter MnhG/PhaG subunit
VTAVLLGLSVALMTTGVVGVLVAHDVYDRLHFTGPASIFAPTLVAVAVAADFGPVSQAGLKAVLTAILIVCLNPVLVHATARAARVRAHGRLDYDPPSSRQGAGR